MWSFTRRLLRFLDRAWREPIDHLAIALMHFQYNGLVTGPFLERVARMLIRYDPNRHRFYQYLGSALHPHKWPESVQAWTEGKNVQRRAADETHVPPDVRYFTRMWTCSIGHHSLLDLFAKRRILNLSPAQRYVIFAPNQAAANFSYLRLWRDWFEIITDAEAIDPRSRRIQLAEEEPTVLSVGGEWKWLQEAASIIQEKWYASSRGPLLSLPDEYEQAGRQALMRLGMPADAWFVTLHIRQSARSPRNADPETYRSGLRKITEAGGWVVRIGGPRAAPLAPMDRVIDYAALDRRDDVLDVFLMARPRFFLGTNSGPAWVAGTFGTPALLTNWMPIGLLSYYANTVTVPQLLWSNDKNRALTFAEQLAAPLGFTQSSRRLAQLGMAPIVNTPDEIAEAVEEILNRTNGTWPPDADDAKRQQLFRQLQKRSNAYGRSDIGRAFLRNHAELLDV